MRRAMDAICRRAGEPEDLPRSSQLPAPCVTTPTSPGMGLRTSAKRKLSESSQTSTPSCEPGSVEYVPTFYSTPLFHSMASTSCVETQTEPCYGRYCKGRLQQLLTKMEVARVKQAAKEVDEGMLDHLKECGLAEGDKLIVDVLKEAIRRFKRTSRLKYGALRVSENRDGLLSQLESVLPHYEANDISYVYKPSCKSQVYPSWVRHFILRVAFMCFLPISTCPLGSRGGRGAT